MLYNQPEILCPAGSLDKLKVAILYGANAIYLGGMKYGLREAADNFTTNELKEGVEFAHSHNAKVFVVLNGFLHDEDLESLPDFLNLLEKLEVDAVIVSDLGVMSCVKRNSKLIIHLSTQASCLNIDSAKLWKNMGATRLVLGREVSITEALIIKKEANIEVELFIHGSMCMAYSGNCVISNYTQGRDSNRGGCAHSCRFEYTLEEVGTDKTSNGFFMSSKDLNGIGVLDQFIKSGIDSLKVEGRMKGQNYAGTVAKVYSEAIYNFCENGKFDVGELESYQNELKKVKHRDYFEGSLVDKTADNSIFDEREHMETSFEVSAIVVEVQDIIKDYMVIEVRRQFKLNDELEVVPFKGVNKELKLDFITDIANQGIEKTRPGQLVKVPYIEGAQKYNIIRGRS